MTAGLWPQVQKGSPPAVTAAVRVSERRSRLLGLDEPTATRQRDWRDDRALEFLFGDKYGFVVTSLIAGTTPIQYHRFSEMADDVVDVRVYQGIHFRRADVVGKERQAIRRRGGQSRAEAD